MNSRRKELKDNQKKKKSSSLIEAQHYTDEDWDLIRAKIKANAELSKSVLGSDLQGEDFAKKMVELGTWKLSQLKNLSFEEVKEEFDKLVKQIVSFAPINFKATKDSLKRFGEELQTKTSKRLKNLDKDDSKVSDKASEQDDYASEISREYLTELYRIIMNRYGMNGPEDGLEKSTMDMHLSGGQRTDYSRVNVNWVAEKATAKVQTVNEVRQIQALVDKKRVIVTESSIRRDLHLDDAECTDCVPTATIFEELACMGYEKPSQKLTFYKAFFSPQWKYFIHTITQCLSAKSTRHLVLSGHRISKLITQTSISG
ncbi:hypothetical protein Tco_0979696 [Tanacetum coccineum]